jgi:glycosyltransferase involved in cell wall biosynthesis
MYYSGIDRSQLTGLATSSSQQSVSSTSNDQKHWTGWIEKRMLHIRAICSKIDLFHAPSKFLMNQFITDFQIPESKIFYLDYGFPTQYLQPVNPENKEFYTFGYIGTHTAAKGINMLIEAYNQLNGKVKLKIFGRTNGQNTAALKRLSVNSRNPVEFAGEYINQNLATKVFNHIDCIVVPSIWAENSPLVIHEAQACKIPVITSDFGGMKEYVEHQVNGLLFNHRDTASLTEQMQFAVDHPEHMRKLGQQGYLFSPGGNVPIIEDHCQELMKCYQKIIQNGK